MLIAQELSKDSETDQKSPNLVAKLMGLDSIPLQEPDFPAQKIHSRLYTRNSQSEIPIGYWKDERGFFNKNIDDYNEYKDIYEILEQSHRTNCRRDKSPQKGKSNENINDNNNKLALIRQKFMEAKRLSTNEKLRNTKEFQEALDFLSSNGDLFLKVLQEPNSLISNHLYVGESISRSPETKQITILRPSKMACDDKFGPPIGKRGENQVKKRVSLNRVNLWESGNHGFPPTMSSWKVSDSNPIKPTQIVVLKPSPGNNESKGVITSIPSSPRIFPSQNFFEEQDEEAREVAKEITQKMRERLSGHRRGETVVSSVLSNGYTGDESSFEKSENEITEGNLSDSEVMSPISRHSWDYVNRYGSPFSSVSFGRASYSHESSVSKEAKRRLSERWAMIASNANNNNNDNNNHNSNNNLDEGHIPRSSSTLGEMLALSEVKKSEICEEIEDDKDRDRDTKGSTLGPSSNTGPTKSLNNSPKNLLRSKSAPLSSIVEVSGEIIKPKTSKISFTGKVTNFFSRNKKSRKETPSKLSSNSEFQLTTGEVDNAELDLSPSSRSRGGSGLIDMDDMKIGQGVCSPEVTLSYYLQYA